jgi:uncharacterized protein (TIGR03437 family)
MKNFDRKYVLIFVIFALCLPLAPPFRAQDLGSITRITPIPDGAMFTVDGQSYSHATSAVWPSGSKHILAVPVPLQANLTRTQYSFNHWQFVGGNLLLNPLPVTASPDIPEYQVIFDVLYGLGLSFSNCSDPTNCQSAGTVTVNGTPYFSSADVYVPANSAVVLQAFPNPGYVFSGWLPGINQTILGFQDTVTMSGPLVVYPIFQAARQVNLATNPPGLTLLADRAPVPTPSSLDWALNSVHTVGANSPQKDMGGKWWAFQSWSDGGDLNHAYTVPVSNMPATLTANFVPAAGVSILTQPVGLQIKVDGQYNALNPYYFAWGIGETHHLEAAAQQTDAQGRMWQFGSWSNGGTATQDVTVTADMAANGLVLTATYTPLTKLTVNSSLAGLSVTMDGVVCATPCVTQRAPGSQVHVGAPASVPQGTGSRADFNGWPGTTGDLVVTMGDSPTTVTATYHLLNQLTTASNPVNAAVWTVLPASPDGFYPATASVALSVTTQPGYKFRCWDGDLSGTIPSGVVTMSAPRAVTALFDPVPYLAPAGVINAAGTTPVSGVAPGGIVSVFGINLAAAALVAPDGMLPQTLGGMTARVGDRILPLFFISSQQINAQLPDDLALGNQVLTVSPAGAANVQATFTAVRNAPGLFPVAVNGQSMAMAVHEDGSPVTADAPAQWGELLTVYGTGFGPASQPRPEGFPIPQSPVYNIVDAVTVQVGQASIAAEQAFAVPGRCAIDAVQFRLDNSVTGTVTLQVTVNGAASNTLLLPVQ